MTFSAGSSQLLSWQILPMNWSDSDPDWLRPVTYQLCLAFLLDCVSCTDTLESDSLDLLHLFPWFLLLVQWQVWHQLWSLLLSSLQMPALVQTDTFAQSLTLLPQTRQSCWQDFPRTALSMALTFRKSATVSAFLACMYDATEVKKYSLHNILLLRSSPALLALEYFLRACHSLPKS